MKLRRVTNLRLALLLALLLPLQAFAALTNCALGAAHVQVHQTHSVPAAADSHCEHAPASNTHHDCGSCCSVVAASNPLNIWLAPPLSTPPLALTRIKSPPSVAIDRLDRPPRTYLT
jgi:hypothetical protein